MKVEIIDKKAILVTELELESIPFVEGSIINIDIRNYNKELFSCDDLNAKAKVLSIEYYITKEYYLTGKVSERFVASVTVEIIPKYVICKDADLRETCKNFTGLCDTLFNTGNDCTICKTYKDAL